MSLESPNKGNLKSSPTSPLTHEDTFEYLKECLETIDRMRDEKELLLFKLEESLIRSAKLEEEHNIREAELEVIPQKPEGHSFDGEIIDALEVGKPTPRQGDYTKRLEEENEVLKTTLDALKKERDALKLENDSVKNAKNIISSEAEGIRQKKDELASKLKAVEEEKKLQEQEVLDAKAKNESNDRLCQELKQQLKQVEEEKKSLAEALEHANADIVDEIPAGSSLEKQTLHNLIEELTQIRSKLGNSHLDLQAIGQGLTQAIREAKMAVNDHVGDDSLYLLEQRNHETAASGNTIVRGDGRLPRDSLAVNSPQKSEDIRDRAHSAPQAVDLESKDDVLPSREALQRPGGNEDAGNFIFSTRTFGNAHEDHDLAKSERIKMLEEENAKLKSEFEEIEQRQKKVDDLGDYIGDLDKPELEQVVKDLLYKIDELKTSAERNRPQTSLESPPREKVEENVFKDEEVEDSQKRVQPVKVEQMSAPGSPSNMSPSKDTTLLELINLKEVELQQLARENAELKALLAHETGSFSDPNFSPKEVVDEPKDSKMVEMYETELQNNRRTIEQLKEMNGNLMKTQEALEAKLQEKRNLIDAMRLELIRQKKLIHSLKAYNKLQEDDLIDIRARSGGKNSHSSHKLAPSEMSRNSHIPNVLREIEMTNQMLRRGFSPDLEIVGKSPQNKSSSSSRPGLR